MSALLEALRTHQPLPFPLPVGPYPTADTAAAMHQQHLSQARADLAADLTTALHAAKAANAHLSATVAQLRDEYENSDRLTDKTYPHSHSIDMWGACIPCSYEDTEDGPAIGKLLINGAIVDAEQVFSSPAAWDRANEQLMRALEQERNERAIDNAAPWVRL